MAYTDTSGYQQVDQSVTPFWGKQATESKLGSIEQQFAGMFKNATGRDPTDQEISQMYSQVIQGNVLSPGGAGLGGTNYSDYQNIFNPYIQNTQGDLIKQNQQQTQTDQTQQYMKQIQDMINKQTQATTQNLTDPNSPAYQTFAGNMNALGITPSSGAFQAGLGGQLAQGALGENSQALSQFGIPSVQGNQATVNAPYQSGLQNMYPGLSQFGQNQSSLYDFGLQSDLAKKLAEEGQPSGFQNAFGMATSGLGAAGQAGAGYGAAKSASGTYICTHLKKIGLATEEEVEAVHKKLFPTIWFHPFDWIRYWAKARELIRGCELEGIDWNIVKKCLIDDILAEPDIEKAFQHYKETCLSMRRDYAPELEVSL